LDSGRDPFLAEILRKYGKVDEESACYEQILEGEAQENPESALAWMQQRCERFSSPEWLETVATFTWNGIYTSAVDTIWLKAFRSDWRELQPLYDAEPLNPLDPRNRSRLHCTFLFGCVNQTEENKRPPLSEDDMDVRVAQTVKLLDKLPELITPLGVLVIEGYAGEQDWLSPEQLVPVIKHLNPGQTHIFSATEELRNNRRISKLTQKGKLVLHSESLAFYLLKVQEDGLIQLGLPPEREEYGRQINLEEKSVTVPLGLWNQVSRSAIILDEALLIQPPHVSQDKLYSEFRSFLAQSSFRPVWSGYGRGFAFKRDFEDAFQERVNNKLASNELQDKPIILHGQTGTGKSVALGRLAYAIRKEGKYPVLYIERRSKQPLLSDLEAFCKWAEDSGASATLIVWDGMLEQEQYYEFTKRLAGRGRKVVLVGSCYAIAKLSGQYRKNKNFVEAPATLDQKPPGKDKQNEISRFTSFISRFDKSLANRSREWIKQGGNRFLVALYRILPETRSQIRSGLTDEVDFAEKEIGAVAQGESIVRKTSFANAFLRAGIITEEQLFSSETQEEIAGENVNQLRKLIRLVMVPGRFGLKVPLEILMRAIGKEGVTNFVNLLDKVNTDIIQWYEDENGSFEIGARHQLEAQEITNSLLGDAKSEVEYAEKLLLHIRENGNFNRDAEIDFAIKLVFNMGPNGTCASYFTNHFQKISEILTKLREEQSIQNTSLMLQEAFLLRETIKNRIHKQSYPQTITDDILDKSENVLRQAINLLGNNSPNKGKRSRLMVELASVLGTRSQYLLEKQNDVDNSLKFLKEAQKTAFEAFALAPDSYYPIDVIGWTSRFILRKSNLDFKSRSDIEANIYHAFTLVETGDFSDQDLERFQSHRVSIGKLTNNNGISEDAFQELIKLGSSAGYYLKAYEMVREILLKDTILEADEIELAKNAVQYLKEHRHKSVNYDARTLYLLLKVWWLSKTGKKLFYGERETVPFNHEDWLECLHIIEDLMKTSEFYENPSLTYLKGLATFHLNQVSQSLAIFKELENDFNAKGRRRIIRSYIASNPDGQPKKYTGEVAWINNNSREIGKVYVSELQRSSINFMPHIFQKPDIRKGESLGEFHIAFNFLGLIADPIAYYEKYQEKKK
jgi:hypothetical protein